MRRDGVSHFKLNPLAYSGVQSRAPETPAPAGGGEVGCGFLVAGNRRLSFHMQSSSEGDDANDSAPNLSSSSHSHIGGANANHRGAGLLSGNAAAHYGSHGDGDLGDDQHARGGRRRGSASGTSSGGISMGGSSRKLSFTNASKQKGKLTSNVVTPANTTSSFMNESDNVNTAMEFLNVSVLPL